MKILEVKTLAIPEIKVIRFARFPDERGYFSETFRKSDFLQNPELAFLKNFKLEQGNESFAKAGVVKGLHFQWQPFMGKLVRTVYGRMVDMVLDIRLGSPTFGKIIVYNMPSKTDGEYSEWIWLPPGFAHGNFFTEDTVIQYFCSGEYSPQTEGGISPLSEDLDWTLADTELKAEFDAIIKSSSLISSKDKQSKNLAEWSKGENAQNFMFGQLPKQ